MARLLYSILYYLLLPLVFARLWRRAAKVPAYRKRWSERLGRPVCTVAVDQPLIWIHAVSVGESMAAESLTKALRQQCPDIQVLVTTTTPTGSELVQQWAEPVLHQYMPVDLPPMLNPLFDAYQPKVLVLMETEVWPNLVAIAQERAVPMVLANGRMSEKSARGYARFSGLTRPAFAGLAQVLAQAPADAERFVALGAPNVEVMGSIKYDIVLDGQTQARLDDLRQWVTKRRIVVAGSTHPGEEDIILDAVTQLSQVYPELLLVLAPRHPDRFAEVSKKLELRGIDYCRRSAGQTPQRKQAVWLLDTLGELSVFYGLADIALVGGSWNPRGSHNPLEPALFGVPVITGESVFNFAAINEALRAAGALQRVSKAHLSKALLDWLKDDAARQQAGAAGRRVLAENQGATERQAASIAQLL
ncbi:lipid IV(A) 3-deoxy-D-manno-octulosonic acid transferase [Salinispirillum sp. LH 10-3-1]|uniref:3-deoxy-D-manno-octulosonic acid transferase n=1 Tax=Salinispirillum sp. LH 10-3-1 TaxID=2952525 RepID=A0AB38YE18_9GAMM